MANEKRRDRQRANRRKKHQPQEQYVSYYNHERYSDPVAAAAINAVVRERRRAHA